MPRCASSPPSGIEPQLVPFCPPGLDLEIKWARRQEEEVIMPQGTQAQFQCPTKTGKKWTHWDLNPGPSECEADVMPLHHVPHADRPILYTQRLECRTPTHIPTQPPVWNGYIVDVTHAFNCIKLYKEALVRQASNAVGVEHGAYVPCVSSSNY